jgi:glucose-6-phosphate 1-epimerase
MMNGSIEQLNRDFGLKDRVVFREGKGGLPVAVLQNSEASAEVCLHGAHVTSFRPRGHEEALWVSELAEYRSGKAIRGGIPVCWPWFGPHPDTAGLPQHGFARVSAWKVSSSTALDDGRCELCLTLRDDDSTRRLWPHSFELELRVTVGNALGVELRSVNTGDATFRVGGALHSYFRVGDIGRIEIGGLDGRYYLDQLDGHNRKCQTGLVSISGEVDRVYVESKDECVIQDPVLGRRIRVGKSGSGTTVVWNPWIDKSIRMLDFPDHGYREMVCIEAANAFQDMRDVASGEQHVLSTSIGLEFA